MNLFFLPGASTTRNNKSRKNSLVTVAEQQYNIPGGSEFDGDTSQMKDQSLQLTEEKIDSINADDLFDYSAE
jgi:hypothetical protein